MRKRPPSSPFCQTATVAVGIEACASSHYWALLLTKLGRGLPSFLRGSPRRLQLIALAKSRRGHDSRCPQHLGRWRALAGKVARDGVAGPLAVALTGIEPTVRGDELREDTLQSAPCELWQFRRLSIERDVPLCIDKDVCRAHPGRLLGENKLVTLVKDFMQAQRMQSSIALQFNIALD